MRKFVEPDVADNPLYHDTWKLLKKYRDVVWSLELSVQHVRTKFEIEYGTSIEDFLDSVYLAGADLAGSDIFYIYIIVGNVGYTCAIRREFSEHHGGFRHSFSQLT